MIQKTNEVSLSQVTEVSEALLLWFSRPFVILLCNSIW